jgi:DNA-binding LacI/PurR family transcriptional regulator
LRIAGHDDQPVSRYTCPALTTVAQDVERLAGHCVDLLLSRVSGESEPGPDRQIRIEAKLMMRASA